MTKSKRYSQGRQEIHGLLLFLGDQVDPTWKEVDKANDLIKIKIIGTVNKFQAVRLLALGPRALRLREGWRSLSVATRNSKHLLGLQGLLVGLLLRGVQPLLLDQGGLFLLSHQVPHFGPVEKLYCYITTWKNRWYRDEKRCPGTLLKGIWILN